jgi:hypothetical protein
MIFEFKKPQRDDFVNPSSQEDPVQQIVRYVNNIRDGKYKTPEGREDAQSDFLSEARNIGNSLSMHCQLLTQKLPQTAKDLRQSRF